MNTQTFVVAMMTGLLTVPEARLSSAWARCNEYINSNPLMQNGKPAVLVWEGNGERLRLKQWLKLARARGIRRVRPALHVEQRGRAPHTMAGFAGGRPYHLEVTWRRGTATYVAGTVTGPARLMTMATFAELVRSQRNPDFYWEKILDDINQYHRCNNISAVRRDELTTFLASRAAEHAWETIGDELFREIQVEAATLEQHFEIPQRLTSLVSLVSPIFEAMERYIWLDVCAESEVTGAQLVRLIEAQPFATRIWAGCSHPDELAAQLEDADQIDHFPRMTAHQWRPWLAGLDHEGTAPVRDILIELIRIECVRADCEPCIPDDLTDVFGPDAEQRRRLHFRGRLQQDLGWMLEPAQAISCNYVFDKTDTAAQSLPGQHIAHSKKEFDAALASIERFAGEIASPFRSCFQAAARFSTQADLEAASDGARVWQLLPPQHAIWDGDARYLQVLIDFGWRAGRVFGLAAIAAADVFGAMASWNDQHFEGELGERFALHSATLFAAMNGYVAALLTIETGRES